MSFSFPLVSVSPIDFEHCQDPAGTTMTADIGVYVDDGLPAELKNYDLMSDLRPVIANGWIIRVD
jgi:hypothetical protein